MFKKALFFAVIVLMLCNGCKNSDKETNYVSELTGCYDVSKVKVNNRDQEGDTQHYEGSGTLDIVSFTHDNTISLIGTTEIDGEEESYTLSATVDHDGIIRIGQFKFTNGFKALGWEVSSKNKEEWDINVTNSTLKLEDRCLSGYLEYSAYDYYNEEYYHGTVSVLGYKMY